MFSPPPTAQLHQALVLGSWQGETHCKPIIVGNEDTQLHAGNTYPASSSFPPQVKKSRNYKRTKTASLSDFNEPSCQRKSRMQVQKRQNTVSVPDATAVTTRESTTKAPVTTAEPPASRSSSTCPLARLTAMNQGIETTHLAGVVQIMGSILQELCQNNEPRAQGVTTCPGGFEAFFGTDQAHFCGIQPPAISIHDYLKRISTYSGASVPCFVMALVYIDRLVERNSSWFVNFFNVHRLLITAILISAKFTDDQYFNNAHYARMGGIQVKELNRLEVQLLHMLQYDLYASEDLYNLYLKEIQRQIGDTSMPATSSFSTGTPAAFPSSSSSSSSSTSDEKVQMSLEDEEDDCEEEDEEEQRVEDEEEEAGSDGTILRETDEMTTEVEDDFDPADSEEDDVTQSLRIHRHRQHVQVLQVRSSGFSRVDPVIQNSLNNLAHAMTWQSNNPRNPE